MNSLSSYTSVRIQCRQLFYDVIWTDDNDWSTCRLSFDVSAADPLSLIFHPLRPSVVRPPFLMARSIALWSHLELINHYPKQPNPVNCSVLFDYLTFRVLGDGSV